MRLPLFCSENHGFLFQVAIEDKRYPTRLCAADGREDARKISSVFLKLGYSNNFPNGGTFAALKDAISKLPDYVTHCVFYFSGRGMLCKGDLYLCFQHPMEEDCLAAVRIHAVFETFLEKFQSCLTRPSLIIILNCCFGARAIAPDGFYSVAREAVQSTKKQATLCLRRIFYTGLRL